METVALRKVKREAPRILKNSSEQTKTGQVKILAPRKSKDGRTKDN